jgi:hypothetical protein
MSRKHYQMVAEVFRNNAEALANGSDSDEVWAMVEVLASDLADKFSADNPNFDRKRFIDACGLG